MNEKDGEFFKSPRSLFLCSFCIKIQEMLDSGELDSLTESVYLSHMRVCHGMKA